MRTVGAAAGGLAAAGSGASARRGDSAASHEDGASDDPNLRADVCTVDDFENGLDAYVVDGPEDGWTTVDRPGGGQRLQFQGGDGAELRSTDLGRTPRRGERFAFQFGTYGNWNRYAMLGFGMETPESNVQYRYELEFEPADDEVRLEYSRAPRDESTIARADAALEPDSTYDVVVDWAASGDELAVTVADADGDAVASLASAEPEDAPAEGEVAFYAAGDAAWTFDDVRVLDCQEDGGSGGGSDGGDEEDGSDEEEDGSDAVAVVDDFERGDLAPYDDGDATGNWAVVDAPTSQGSSALQFQGGGGADVRSLDGLPAYPRRGDRFAFDFGTYGGWNRYAMVSFGMDDPGNLQRRYELEFEPAKDAVRLQYSRAPRDESTVATATAAFDRDRFYRVVVDWAAAGDDLVVTVADGDETLATLRAPEPDGAPVEGGVGFYAAGDAAWAFDDVRILDRGTSDPDDGSDASADWPTFQHDAANTGWNPDATGPTAPLTEAWSAQVGETAANPPAVVGDVVYATGDGEGNGLTALDAADGGERWQYAIARGSKAAPTVVDDTVYVGGRDLHVHAVATDGSRRWRTEVPDSVDVPPVVDVAGAAGGSSDGGAVYAGTLYGEISVLDADSGSIRYHAPVGSIVEEAPAVAGDALYAGCPLDDLQAYTASDGSVRWRAFDDQGRITAPTVVDDVVYAGFTNDDTDGAHVYALGATDGGDRWRYAADVQSALAVADGVVYAADQTGTLHALDAADGSVVWTADLGSAALSAPVVAGGVVYVGSDGALYALDAADGSQHFAYDADYGVVGAPAVVDDTLYVGGTDGRVHALEEQ